MDAITTQQQAATEEIRFAFGNFLMGTVLIATSIKGIVAILMNDDREVLYRELVNAFPGARLTASETELGETVQTIAAFLDAPQNGLDLPLDLRGSALEQSVWQALRDVPAGQTITYGEIARGLPLPVTAQDVGVACAANVLAVAIPCHRVIKADGAISGYRWGVQRKRKLMKLERAA